ncbi:hypothetical protein [Daejeonella sp.]|uniref:hypothetical protein n=1 Tax=Daejeonella sp. TaxID=2805397 RepID=UPI0030C585CE
MPVRHVPTHVKNVQKVVKEIREWNNAQVYAEPALKPAVNVQKIAEATVAMLLKQHSVALMLAVRVPKNAKSTMTKCAKNAQKNAENVKQNAEILQLKNFS